MNSNKEKFLALVSEIDAGTMKNVAFRIKNRAMLRESQKIAIKAIMKLEELNWTQRDLATAMEVSPQQVNKILKAKQNLTLNTIVRLQAILNIPLLASFYEKGGDDTEKAMFKEGDTVFVPTKKPPENYTQNRRFVIKVSLA